MLCCENLKYLDTVLGFDNPPARMIAERSKPLINKSCAAPTLSECPETSWSFGRSHLLTFMTPRLIMSFTFRSEIGRSTQRSWFMAQKSGWVCLGLCLSHLRISLTLRSDPNTSRPSPYWSVLLFLMVPRSVPSFVNWISVVFRPTFSDRRARKSYPSDRSARLRVPASVSGCAAIILISKSWLIPTACLWSLNFSRFSLRIDR